MSDATNNEPAERRIYVSPLRERHAQQTRDAILDALTRLLETQGADEITTRAVAREAGVAERSVYRHFPDRAALVEGLTARLETFRTRATKPMELLEDLKPVAIQLMAEMEAHPIEARAETLFNSDPRRYSAATQEHTRQFTGLVAASFPELDEYQQRGLAAIVRVLVSSQAWLRMREEFGVTGEASGPMAAWALDAVMNEIRRGNPPPSIGKTARVRRPRSKSPST